MSGLLDASPATKRRKVASEVVSPPASPSGKVKTSPAAKPETNSKDNQNKGKGKGKKGSKGDKKGETGEKSEKGKKDQDLEKSATCGCVP